MTLQHGNIVTDLKRWIEAYLAEVRVKNLSDRTVEIYTRILEDFLEFARSYQGEADLVDINRLFLNAYLSEQSDIKKSFGSTTKKLHVTVLKTFFNFITENNDDNVDYGKMFKKLTIKTEIKEKPALSEQDAIKVLNYLEKEKTSYRNQLTNVRNALLIKTFLYSGLRTNELLPLRLSDYKIELDEKVYSILVRGKGDKERYVYVPSVLIKDELEVLRETNGEHWHVCSTKHSTIINRSNLWTIVSGIMQRAGVDQTGLHILRHSFARRLVNSNTNLKTISELLGHSDVATTAKYYARSNEGNKKAAVAGMAPQAT